jgi:hypothetical protein
MNTNSRTARVSGNREIEGMVQMNAFVSCKFVGAARALRGASCHLVMAGDPRRWSRKQNMPEKRTL